jgi:dTDP-4-dehydrorhamnose reductase
MIHFSTDCVFSGRNGHYTEKDVADATDVYGRTKFLGEVSEPGCVTLRTSIIGRELRRKTGLLEWFLAQEGRVRGYTRAVFSGFTTLEMARIVEMILVDHPQAHGLYHVSSAPITKHELLVKIRDRLGRPVEIDPDPSVECDRSLDSSRFQRDFGYQPPGWDEMIEELAVSDFGG